MVEETGTITLLDVSQKPFVPVTIILEERGLETIEWLIGKAEEILGKIGSATTRPNAANAPSQKVKVKVRKLVVGDLEITRENWHERNVDHYRILGDPWFIQTSRTPELPEGETVVTTLVYESPIQRSLIVCSGGNGHINYGNGVVEFTNFAPENLQRREWNKSGSTPKWRIASPGLCVEGKCVNEECKAKGNMVIINMGFCSFTLPDDVYKCKCPLCSTHIQPVTCAFNNCRWKWAGRKLELHNAPTHHREEWQIADDAYHQFKPKGDSGGTAQWLKLAIFTEKPTYKPITCAICLMQSIQPTETYECGCQLHKVCVLNFPYHTSEKNSSVCPTCYMKNLNGCKRMGISNFDKP